DCRYVDPGYGGAVLHAESALPHRQCVRAAGADVVVVPPLRSLRDGGSRAGPHVAETDPLQRAERSALLLRHFGDGVDRELAAHHAAFEDVGEALDVEVVVGEAGHDGAVEFARVAERAVRRIDLEPVDRRAHETHWGAVVIAITPDEPDAFPPFGE